MTSVTPSLSPAAVVSKKVLSLLSSIRC